MATGQALAVSAALSGRRSGPAKDERFQNIDGHSPSLQDDPQCMKKKKGLFFALFQIIVPFPNKMVVLSSSD